METLHPNKTGIYIKDGDITSQQDRYLYRRWIYRYLSCWRHYMSQQTGIYIKEQEVGDITSQQDRYLY